MEEKEFYEEQKDESEIELHPEVAKQRQDTYHSLTDLNGIDVFSTEFEASVKAVMGEQIEKLRKLEGQVFDQEPVSPKSTDEELTDKLFTGQQETILRHDYTKDQKGVSVMDIGMVLLAMLAVCGIYMFFFQDRKARKKRL